MTIQNSTQASLPKPVVAPVVATSTPEANAPQHKCGVRSPEALVGAARALQPRTQSLRLETPAVARNQMRQAQRARDEDPMTHIRYLASDELEGRDSPSEGLNKAAKYIADFAKRYGLEGANPSDVQSPFYQTFQMYRFSDHTEAVHGLDGHGHSHGGHSHVDEHGNHVPPRWFEDGFTFSPNTTQEDLDAIYESLKKVDPAKAERFKKFIRIGDDAPRGATESLLNSMFARGQVQNVVARLEGTGPNKDEVIVLMAHYDHIGKGWFGRGINNGADDNASGSAALMSVIPKLVDAQKRGELDRSVVFLWTAAEEKGLIGATHYVRNPLPGAGLEDIEGIINVDMVGRFDDEQISVRDKTNGSTNYFSDLIADANSALKDPFDNVNRNIENLRNRQDGWVFTRAGEDVAVLFEGFSSRGRMNPDYHRPSDTVANMEKDNGGAKVRKATELLGELAIRAANR